MAYFGTQRCGIYLNLVAKYFWILSTNKNNDAISLMHAQCIEMLMVPKLLVGNCTKICTIFDLYIDIVSHREMLLLFHLCCHDIELLML